LTVELIPCSENAFGIAARRILDHHKTLPDLTHCRILLPDLNGAPALRRALLTEAQQLSCTALLGPTIQTLNEWLLNQWADSPPVLSPAAQELVLVEAIRHSKIFNSHDPWLLTSELLSLFSEITLARTPLENFDQFKALLREGYGIGTVDPEPFTDEARIVFTLWKAWQQQLQDDGFLDSATALLIRLANSLEVKTQDETIWIIGCKEFSSPYIEWMHQLLNLGHTRLLLHGSVNQTNNNLDNPLNKFVNQLDCPLCIAKHEPAQTSLMLDCIFDTSTQPLRQRATEFSKHYPVSPLKNHLATLHTNSAEQEASAIVLQIRCWLLEDKQSIGIISEDRKLARRVRALLEREDIELKDSGGWALSTTSSAAVLERWLETVEEDFSHTSLLDVLKSPFVCLFENRQDYLHTVRRFEQDIVQHENIARGLDRYRKHLNLRANRLPDWSETNRHDIEQLLNWLDHAAEPLRNLLQGEHPVTHFTAALTLSLQELGIDTQFETDPAGLRILDEIQSLHAAAETCGTSLNWQEFRGWLGRSLERFTFQPPTNQSTIQLMTLAQCALQHFDGVIIAGCIADQLPGKPGGQAFFNQAVRAELGLTTWQDTLQLKLHQFRCALEAAPQVLLTCCVEQNGEPVSPTPWLELLEIFHDIAYQESLHSHDLAQLLRALQSQSRKPSVSTNEWLTSQPAPCVNSSALPKHWTASTHQRLIDCPYRFFAADILQLSAQEEIREALEKADYGEYVHRILQAFHGGIKSLPGPWQGRLTAAEKDLAINLLNQISQTVFQPAIDANLAARGWLKRWLAYLPEYINWTIERNKNWQLHSVEQRMQREIAPGIDVKGRVDRIDVSANQQAIIDYKTGMTPNMDAVETGEAVQLPSYALLSEDNVSRVEYIQFDKNKIYNNVNLEGDKLEQLVNAIKQRLLMLTDSIGQGQPLPAWGDPGVCRYCEYDVVCRRDSWQDNAE
jgi:ATP-dependent helicase/nuclease subunit B